MDKKSKHTFPKAVLLLLLPLLLFTTCETYDYQGSLFSPASCLEQIITACEEHFFVDSLSRYAGALDDGFTFHFSKLDIGDTYSDFTVPQMWDKSHERTAIKELFNRVMFISFRMELLEEESFPTPPGDAEEFWTPGITVRFLVDPGGDERLEASGTCDFLFVKQDDGRWKLLEWHDLTNESASSGTATTSIGAIKAEYYSKHF